jgi:hypothetical protein
MSITGKYLEALKTFDDWVIVSEWATRFGGLYPDLLEKANQEAANQANETTGLREIAARISSAISRGAYENSIEIDTSERPRKVKFVPEDQRGEHETQEIEEDVAPLRREERIKKDLQTMSVNEKYRTTEFETIAKQLRGYFGLDFEVDHAQALLNQEKPGRHHPDNLQLIIKAHNVRKSNDSWERFTLDEQIEYIESVVRLQEMVASRFESDLDKDVIDSLLMRLKKVY